MNGSLSRCGGWPAAMALVALHALLLSGCEPFIFQSTSKPLCDPPTVTENCRNRSDSNAALPGALTPAATAQRFPVVALPDNRDAQIMASAREGDDRQNPVHKFLYRFNLDGPAVAAGLDLAGPNATAQTFIASGRSDLSGTNNSLTADASGVSTSVWVAGNATALVELADPLSFPDVGIGLERGPSSLALLAADSPLLGGLLLDSSRIVARAYRFVP